MTKPTKGKLAHKPLAEIIREIGEARASGVLRLSRDRAKAVVYIENGEIAYAASNIRPHRLVEFLKRTGILDEHSVNVFPANATDAEILDVLVNTNLVRADRVAAIRANHVADVLRGVLLWTDGDWQFDGRVRIAGDTRVTIDISRLLLESTRHLPAPYVAARFADAAEQLDRALTNGQPANLLPSEVFILSRIEDATTIGELLAISGMNREETLQSLYALVICGAVRRAAWAPPQLVGSTPAKAQVKSEAVEKTETVDEFLARIESASNFYEVLGVSRQASADAIKNSYHSAARRYHPDLFHQADAQLASRIESAFARVAQAYEALGEEPSRSVYDRETLPAQPLPKIGTRERSAPSSQPASHDSRAESSFQKGLAAVKQNQLQQAMRFFAEAASLEPRCARYRAEYGRALINDPQTRRLAEFELKAAINLEPNNTSYRIAIAELYKALGLLRRAQGELQRALTADPKNAAARKLLDNLKN